MDAAGRARQALLVDPMLEPINFGFVAFARPAMREVRRALPEAEMLMGTGNLTELTDADSLGVTAMLLGICSELCDPQRAGRAGQPATRAARSRSTTPRAA